MQFSSENIKVQRKENRFRTTVSFDIFMDNYFTSFSLLTHLEVNNI